MLGIIFRKMHRDLLDQEQRRDARDELVAQSVWLAGEMERV